MSWSSALKKQAVAAFTPAASFARPEIPQHKVDWARLVSLDFETYYDADYTLSKLSTSEYIRDPRFKAQMLGIKIGSGKTRIIAAKNIKAELAKINWSTHAVLCHNTQFDAFILSHHYGIHPAYLYDTLSMARGLHSNDIGAGLDEVSIFYGGQGKLDGLESTKGVLVWDKALFAATSAYCANDVDEMFRVFKEMLPKMPADEMDLIDLTCRMFCSPVLKVDIPRVEAELKRELDRRQVLMYEAVDPKDWEDAKLLKGKEKELAGTERELLIIKRVIGSNEKFADLLRAEGVEPPVKISPAWIKKPKDLRDEEGKWAYAFAKDDAKFIELPNRVEDWGFDLNDPGQVKLMVARQERLQALVDVRIATKSTTNVTRAERFLTAGANGMGLPVGYAYYRAHCLTGDAQVLTRSGWAALESWTGGDIAQWSPDGSMSFAAATPNSFDVQEPLVRAKGRYHQCVYTKGHTLPTLTSHGTFKPRKAGEALTTRFDIPLTGVLDGNAAITPLDAQLAVMVQADGNIRSDPSRGLCVRFGFVKARKIERCKALLEQAGIAYTEQWEEHVCRIRVGAAHYTRLIKHVGPYKQFDKDFFDAPAATKAAFISELSHWDGDVEPQPKGFTYVTTDKYNAEFVATMAHISGRAAFTTALRRDHWSEAYRVYIRRDTKTRSTPKDYEEVPFSGRVYCPTTQTGYFLVRQNDNIVVTGNTGRWGGQNKMNMQNLTRGGELRLSILAPKGHVVCVQDSGQIEARVNGWLWGQDDLLDAFKAADAGTGRDAYCNFGDHIYGRQITKADKMERFVGKVCVLGLGFQMGAPKFQITLAKGALGGPPVYFELDRCKAIVNTYRSKNWAIVQGWGTCKRIIEDMAAGRQGTHGPINWEKETIWLPNGMALKYPDLRKSRNEENGWDEWSYQAKDQRKKIYGGLLCENIVQALARIIVAWQMLQISRKYRVVMTTHDEVVALAKAAQGQKCIDFMAKCMSTAPGWCPDIPLNCEGGFDVNYSK